VRHRISLTLTFQDPNVSGYSIASFQQDDIPDHQFGHHLLSLIVPRDLGLLWQRSLKLHNAWALAFLITEHAGQNQDQSVQSRYDLLAPRRKSSASITAKGWSNLYPEIYFTSISTRKLGMDFSHFSKVFTQISKDNHLQFSIYLPEFLEFLYRSAFGFCSCK